MTIIKIFLFISIIFTLSCSINREDKIKINSVFELYLIDTLVYKLKPAMITKVSCTNNYIFISYENPLYINCFDSTGSLICSLSQFGEGPGEGYLTCFNGVFLNRDTIIVLFPSPPKISKFNMNGAVIENNNILVRPMFADILNDSIIVFSCFQYNEGTKYMTYNLNTNNLDSIISIILFHPNSEHQKLINEMPARGSQQIFSTNENNIYIPDYFNASILVYNIEGDLIHEEDLNIIDWSTMPFIEIKIPNSNNTYVTKCPSPIFPQFFYDSLICIQVIDYYRNDWNDYLNSKDSFGDINDTFFNKYLYIYNENFKLIDVIDNTIESNLELYTDVQDNFIYSFRLEEKEDNSYLIRYRYRLEEIDN